ncbi:CGNR zinc finger domain-containing protein [Streptomyces winkii]|uniref:CGNR zinc finger domain-containing protein n=1 Tax=Streptomyces winkii TaxID=3051178 RepID=UPI0028D6A6DF|nr:ABATE domain-containing protein [Streptomyces sp. DSM 40971]
MTAKNQLRFDAGRICLDLLATVGARHSPAPVERMDGEARLVEWLRGTGLVSSRDELDADATWLEAFTSLRGRLHRVIHTELDGEAASAEDLRELNRAAAAGAPPAMLEREVEGGLHRRLVPPVRCEQLLAAVADDAIRLLGSSDRWLLRECEGPTCDLVYVDTSRGRRRRWCSASACGNRHYVAEHRARRTHPA